MGISPQTFTGVSKFSTDFQSILSRAVSIANLPVKALQQDQRDLTDKKVALSSLSATVNNLASSVSALASLGSNKSLGASSTNISVATATVSGTPQTGTYTVSNITSLARQASSVSGGFSNASSATVAGSGKYLQLAVGSSTWDLNLTEATNNLNGVRDAINNLGAGVTATIITTGGTTPEYHLSITANNTGANPIELRTATGDSTTNILQTLDAGSDAQFKLNGQSVTRKTNSITDVIPGLTLSLSGTTSGSDSAQITVSSDRSGLSAALNNLVRTYNAVVDSVDQQTGKDAGVLSGDISIREVREAMTALVSYTGTGSIQSLTDLGISLDDKGNMSFDSSAIDNLSDDQLAGAFSFLGSATTGLGAVASQLTGLSDPATGLFEQQQADYDKTVQSMSDQIAAISDRIQNMQLTLQAKLQAADALLAQLDQQQGMLTASIQSLNMTSYGKSTGQ
jgi:flagellar hook-associated protein 2